MEDTMLKEAQLIPFQKTESQEERMERLDRKNSENLKVRIAREKEQITKLKKELKGEKEEFDYKKYENIRSGSEPKTINHIVAHATEASYYLSHPEIKTIEEFVEFQDYMES